MEWRWDQGRLEYFRFDSLRRIAAVLLELDGIRLDDPSGDPLRVPLGSSGLPFLPAHYRVWRNYARVFEAACLAANLADRLAVTDLCRQLALGQDGSLTADDYLAFLVPRVYFPSPAFSGYAAGGPRCFPFCALLRYLIVNNSAGGFGAITLNEVFSKLIGNGCLGSESIKHYLGLPSTATRPEGDQKRQVRELLIFFSQFSFLQWSHPNTLFLDVDALDGKTLLDLERLATPLERPRLADRAAELLEIGRLHLGAIPTISVPSRQSPSDLTVTEGSRVMVNHLRIERSPKLRQMFFDWLGRVPPCDMCEVAMRDRYPWTDNMLELHHLLPLASTVRVELRGTSLSDIVPLCPNCHKSAHMYYRQWLKSRQLLDFRSKDEAIGAYSEAKEICAA